MRLTSITVLDVFLSFPFTVFRSVSLALLIYASHNTGIDQSMFTQSTLPPNWTSLEMKVIMRFFQTKVGYIKQHFTSWPPANCGRTRTVLNKFKCKRLAESLHGHLAVYESGQCRIDMPVKEQAENQRSCEFWCHGFHLIKVRKTINSLFLCRIIGENHHHRYHHHNHNHGHTEPTVTTDTRKVVSQQLNEALRSS